jgi:4-carboxymuconolactone decarboxylase
MRLPLIDPRKMNSSQKSLFDEVKSGIPDRFTIFKITDPDTGALIGPWNAWLHEPEMGAAMWVLSKAVAGASAVPASAREVAILVVGAHYNAGYEIYAHTAIAKSLGMSRERLSALCAGIRPQDLDPAESAAFDTATALMRGGVLPEPIYFNTVETLGQHGANQLLFLVGLYSAVAVLLNAYDVPVP